MAEAKQGMFREAALERLTSPERLDTVIKIVSPKSWIPLATAAVIIVATIVWGIVGRLPITATARGILLRPRTIRAVQAAGSGLLTSFSAREGDSVKKGQSIGTIDQYDLRQKLTQTREKLRELDAHRKVAVALETKSDAFELAMLARQRAYTEQRVKDLGDELEKQRKLDETVLAQDRVSVAERLRASAQIVEASKKRVQVFAELKQNGLAREEEALDAERSALDAQNRILDLKKEEQSLNLREAENERQRLERVDRIATLRDQLAELELKEARVKKQEQESLASYEREKLELDDSISSLELSLAKQGQVTAECDGRIVELSAAIGQQVQQGMRLALIEEGDPSRELVCLAYIAVKDGKRTVAGARAQVEPDTVQRERFGGIRGKVKDVSPFPVSAEAAQSSIGSAEVSKELLGEGSKIQVTIELEPDASTASGYAWSSSRGPDLKVTAGTTANIRLKLEDRAPITFVLPYLRELLGL